MSPIGQETQKLSLKDGALASLMVGVGETYLAAYTLALGFGEVAAGLITVLPVFIGSTFQLGSGAGARYMGSAQRWIIVCAWLQALALLGLATAAFLPAPTLIQLFVFASLYWTAGLSIAPIWNVWLCSVIPAQEHINFFSSRSRITQFFTFAGLVSGGLLLKFAERSHQQMGVFAGLLLAALVFRISSIFFLKQQPDMPSTSAAYENLSFWSVLQQLTRKKSIFIVTFLFLMNAAVYFSSPYFAPYMLRTLNLPYDKYMILISSSFIIKVISYSLMVSIVQSRGLYTLVLIGIIGIVPVPALWTTTNNYWSLVAIHGMTGFVWGCFEFGLTLMLLQHYSERHRAQVLVASNFFNAFGMALGSLAGALYMQQYGTHAVTYHHLFWISSALRALPLFMVPLFIHKSIKPIPIFLRSLGMRPVLGAIFKPVLANTINLKKKAKEQTSSTSQLDRLNETPKTPHPRKLKP